VYLQWISASSKFIRISGFPDFWISGFPDFQIPGFPKFIFGFPDFRIFGFPDFRISGFPDFQKKNSDFRISRFIFGFPDFPDFGRSLEGMLHLHVCHFPFFDGFPDFRIPGFPKKKIGFPDFQIYFRISGFS
jgi:hypothetical protein